MAYTNVWNDATPTGAEAANTIDDIFRSLKVDIEQRFIDIFGTMPNFTADPLRPYGLKFTDAQSAKIFMGDNTGTPRPILIRDKADTTTYYTLAHNLFTIPKIALAQTDGGSVVSVSGAAITIFDVVLGTDATYIVVNAAADGSGGALALVTVSNGAATAQSLFTTAPAGSSTISGAHVQLTQFTGSGHTLNWSYLRIR